MEHIAQALRDKALSVTNKSIKLASLINTCQAEDIGKPITFDGYSRIHCFSELPQENWISDPLPTIPAARKLGCSIQEARETQVFQLAACNLRCWYCFVDYDSLSPESPRSKEFSIEELIAKFIAIKERPRVIDLSGGNPGLVPEWILWSIRTLKSFDAKNVYLWADDNLTVDYYSTVLTRSEIQEISIFPRFGSVGCFKGFDDESFSFNTSLPPGLFATQFNIFKTILSFGWDLYGYVTFTTHSAYSLPGRISKFVDRLQEIDENLPLRVIPLKIKPYSPTKDRMREIHEKSLRIQYDVLHCWLQELEHRFRPELLRKEICDIPYVSRKHQ